MPVISLSNQKDIALEVTVSNLNGDDAYEASVLASFPKSLTYSAFRVPANVSLSPHTHTQHTLYTLYTHVHVTCNLLSFSGSASKLCSQ